MYNICLQQCRGTDSGTAVCLKLLYHIQVSCVLIRILFSYLLVPRLHLLPVIFLISSFKSVFYFLSPPTLTSSSSFSSPNSPLPMLFFFLRLSSPCPFLLFLNVLLGFHSSSNSIIFISLPPWFYLLCFPPPVFSLYLASFLLF